LKDFSLTPFLRGKISLYQPKSGYRFNIDSVLLSDFFKPTNQKGTLIDLGTGSGIIPILISLRYPDINLSALEVQHLFVETARENFKLNKVDVNLIHADVKQVRQFFKPESFDYVITNPPYIKSYSSKNENLEIARSEKLATLDDFLKASKYLLKNKGRLFIVFPVFRFVELVERLIQNKLIPKRVRFIHPTASEPATNVLIEAQKSVKSGNETVEKPLIVYKDSKNKIYTKEVEKILKDFCF